MNAARGRKLAAGVLLLLVVSGLIGAIWPAAGGAAAPPASRLVLGDAAALARWWALATRTMLVLVVAASALAAVVGVLLGALSAFVGAGGGLLSRLIELSSSVPALILVGLWRLWDASGGVWSLFGALALVRSLEVAELVRAQLLATLPGEFIEASRALGATRRWQLRSHVAPRLVRPLLVNLCAGAASLIGLEAALGFTGLGLPSHVPSWGGGLSLLAGAGRLAPLAWVVLGIAAGGAAFHTLGMSLAAAEERPGARLPGARPAGSDSGAKGAPHSLESEA